jgi:NADPH:quinone reductase-like Zn-dependent oxidoreductase
VHGEALRVHPDAQDLTEIASLIDSGKLKPIVADVFPLEEARKAQETVRSGKVHGKVVLKVRD